MSGYIKLHKDLTDDPRLADLAEDVGHTLIGDASCDASRYALLGITVTLWVYADTHIRDDDTLPIRIGALARLLRFPEAALRKLPRDWLVIREDGSVLLPGYREKNGLISREKRKELARERTKRWREKLASGEATGDVGGDGVGDASRMQQRRVASPSPSPSPSPVSTSLRSVDGARKRATKRCPEDFEPPEAERASIRLECPDIDLVAEERKLRDHEFAKPKSDWLATWRNWMREAQSRAKRTNGAGRPARYDELMARVVANAPAPVTPTAALEFLAGEKR